jgi:hypothetical protein
MPRREKTVYLVDGNAQIHRAYFAIRGLATSRGLPTGATYGFTTMLRKLVADEEPEWLGSLPSASGVRAQGQPQADGRRPAGELPHVRVREVFRHSKCRQADDVTPALRREQPGGGVKGLLQLVNDRVLVRIETG